ncbi:MAG: type II toxin-antitoxin system RelE/ParE family toxin [Planctomycetes bacterium]|nr:type II toxin-antitoxin system RelE/ParE family toxin [Planctomycetota bacterium]
MASYRVFIKPSAGKELEAIDPRKERERVAERIRALAADPRPHGCEKLSGRSELYRVRVGRYRFVFSIDDSAAEIQVVKVGHRKEVYR